MKIKHALQKYLLEIGKYTQKTMRSYLNNLNLFVRYLDEEADSALVQRQFLHFRTTTTRRYIGIKPQRIAQAIERHSMLL